mgnify:CR=1 FL=1
MHRTRIKICGITRKQDLDCAVQAGADAIGFVFYPPSPRYLSPEEAAALSIAAPPFVTRVGLFVNAEPTFVKAVLGQVSIDLLQFHGEENAAYCEQFDRPYIKVARMRPGIDLLEFANTFPTARGLLLDAWVEAYGGAGQSFDWSLIPEGLPLPVVLSGGLHAGNVVEAVVKTRPWAVDVSSGVELSKGIKDAEKIAAFIAAVRMADVRQ